MEILVNIGAILKEKRLELGYSLDVMSEKTKLSKIQLNAIEEGNISFFKDDLSYLTYFVRYYANALGINYNDIRVDLDETISGFTETLSISKINEMERIDESVATKKKVAAPRKRKVAKVDFANMGMIVLALAILLGLGFVFVKVILPGLQGSGDNPIVSRPKPPTVTDPETPTEPDSPSDSDTEKPGDTPTETPGEGEEFVVEKVDATTYDIKNWKADEDVLIEVVVNVATTLRFTIDGAVQTTPASGEIYNPGATIPLSTKAAADRIVEISVGFPYSNQIQINGVDVELDESIQVSKVATNITFRFIGE